jgi:hypothetical protein
MGRNQGAQQAPGERDYRKCGRLAPKLSVRGLIGSWACPFFGNSFSTKNEEEDPKAEKEYLTDSKEGVLAGSHFLASFALAPLISLRKLTHRLLGSLLQEDDSWQEIFLSSNKLLDVTPGVRRVNCFFRRAAAPNRP